MSWQYKHKEHTATRMATMEKPQRENYSFYIDFLCQQDKYYEHIASLKPYPCSGTGWPSEDRVYEDDEIEVEACDCEMADACILDGHIGLPACEVAMLKAKTNNLFEYLMHEMGVTATFDQLSDIVNLSQREITTRKQQESLWEEAYKIVSNHPLIANRISVQALRVLSVLKQHYTLTKKQ